MYLLIQNKGVAPVEAFTLLGASTTRGCGADGAIGQFGTGTKHSINLLLRRKHDFKVYCSKTRLEFQTEVHTMNDGLVSKDVDKVFCQFGGTSKKRQDLGWVLEFGALDWTDIGMALREFISNAIDRTIRELSDFIPALESGDLVVKIVDDNQVQAKDGYTRVFVKVDDDGSVLRYLAELPKRFLHFSKNPGAVKCSLLTKDGRNLGDKGTAMIYREGVFVREISETTEPSLYDYNFKAPEITIDDCRNSNEYAIKAACAGRLRRAAASELVPVFQALSKGQACYEAILDPYYLLPTWDSAKEGEKKEWTSAWQTATGGAVAASKTGDKHAKSFTARKGHQVAEIPEAWVGVAQRFGVTTTNQVLNEDERKGREMLPATEAALAQLDKVWELLELVGVTNGKTKPNAGCYRELSSNAECSTMGFFQPGGDTVYTREDISSGENKYLFKTMLEEVGHYVTGATDNSRDFQNFFMDVIAELVS